MARRRSLLLSGTLILIALLIAGALWWKPWQHSEIVTIQSVQPPICTQSVLNQECGDGLIIVRTQAGAETEYRYNSDIIVESVNGTRNVTSLRKGDKVSLTFSMVGAKITKI